MRRSAALALLLLAGVTCQAQTRMPASDAFSLDSYQWQSRLLLVFAPSVRSPAYEKQMQLLEGEAEGFAARDLLLFRVLLEGPSYVGDEPLPEGAGAALRRRFDLDDDDFAILLVGKDGTEKRRDDAPLQVEAVYRTIDAMPMRQREMRERGRQ